MQVSPTVILSIMSSSTTLSESSDAETTPFPTKEQAIVFDAIDGITIQDYTLALGKVTDPKNIHFVSRISHGRVCCYLNSKETADKITEEHLKLDIGQHSLEARPLISKGNRIILSNVYPTIPHQVIIDELLKHKIRPCSDVTFMKAEVSDPSFAHVLSFRREVYVYPEDIPNLPSVMEINHDSTNYWVYSSTEKLFCFFCEEEGHLAKFYKNINNVSEPSLTNPKNSEPCENTKQEEDNISSTSTVNNDSASHTDLSRKELPADSIKRPLSCNTSNSSSLVSTVDNENVASIVTKEKKSRKKLTLEEKLALKKKISSELSPAKDFIQRNSHIYPLDWDKIVEFLALTYYEREDSIKKIALDTLTAALFGNEVLNSGRRVKLTSYIPALINMLVNVKGELPNCDTKKRIKRIIEKLEAALKKTAGTNSSTMNRPED